MTWAPVKQYLILDIPHATPKLKIPRADRVSRVYAGNASMNKAQAAHFVPNTLCPANAVMAEARLQALNAELGETRRALKRACDQNVRRSRRHGLTAHQEDIALRAYLLSGYNLEIASAVLQHVVSKRNGQCQPKPEDEVWQAAVSELFLEADVDAMADKARWGAHDNCMAARTAERLVHECSLKLWAHRMNVERGVAPGTSAVLRAACEGMQDPMRVRALGEPCNPAERAWGVRWRQRWGGRIGKLRVREPLAQEEVKQKVIRNGMGSRAFVFFEKHKAAWWPHLGRRGNDSVNGCPENGPTFGASVLESFSIVLRILCAGPGLLAMVQFPGGAGAAGQGASANQSGRDPRGAVPWIRARESFPTSETES